MYSIDSTACPFRRREDNDQIDYSSVLLIGAFLARCTHNFTSLELNIDSLVTDECITDI